MQNESELSHCQMQSKRFFIQRRALSLSLLRSLLIVTRFWRQRQRGSDWDGDGDWDSGPVSIYRRECSRTYVCMCVCVCVDMCVYVCSLTWSYARNSDPVSVSVSVCLWSLSQRSGRSSSSCAEILAALLTSLTFHFISISTPTNAVFSLCLPLAYSLRPLIYSKSRSIYIGSSLPLHLSSFCLLYRCAHSVQLNLITQVRGCLSVEFICLRILNLRGAYVTQVTLRTYV